MAAFTYRALGKDGNVSRGVLEGDSERHVRTLLRQKQLQPIDVALAATGRKAAGGSTSNYALAPARLTVITRQLATLLLASVPLEEALAATARQADHATVKHLLMEIRSKVLSGQSLSASMAAFPASFPAMYRAMVRAGEHAGFLGDVLEQLADYNERRLQLQRQVSMALVYPLILVLIACVVITVLMIFVMPEMVGLFEQTDTPLPALTRMLIAVSVVLGKWWWLMLMLVLLGAVLVRKLLADGKRRWLDAMLLRLPLAGKQLRIADTSRFASTLSILVRSGVALTEAIGIAAEVMSNSILRQRTMRVAHAVAEGGSLAQSLAQCGFVSPMLVQLVATGESSGNLEQMLDKAARTQEQELQAQLGMLVKVLEPMIILIMAVIVGAIVLSVLLPVLQMNTLVT